MVHLETKSIELDGCNFEGDGVTPTKRAGTLMNVELRTPDGKTAQTVIDAGYSGSLDVEQMEHGVLLFGSIGSVLFFHETTFVYACGAHGNTTASFTMWDAEAGKPIEMLGDVPDKAALAKKAAELLDAADGEDSSAHEDDALPELVQLEPAYGARGALRLDAQFMRAACYACSDGFWSSYSRSVGVETHWMPERFSAWAMPPVSVKVFLELHPGFALGGWSRP